MTDPSFVLLNFGSSIDQRFATPQSHLIAQAALTLFYFPLRLKLPNTLPDRLVSISLPPVFSLDGRFGQPLTGPPLVWAAHRSSPQFQLDSTFER